MSVTIPQDSPGHEQGEPFVCLAPDCETVFMRGKGGNRVDKKYCSTTCRKRAERYPVRLTPLDKAGELSIKAARLQRTIEETLSEVRTMAERQDAITRAFGVANAAHVALFLTSLAGERERQQKADMEVIQ